MKYKIYTDGACSPHGRGGAAFIVVDEDDVIIKRCNIHIDNATNNICELTAIYMGCEYARKNLIHNTDDYFTIYSDSAYCINCYAQQWYKGWINNGWKTANRTPVKNKKLWEDIIVFFQSDHFNFRKVKGHSNDKYNIIVDQLAVDAKYF